MSNHDREGSHPSNRDTPLERAWREVSDEQPPAHLTPRFSPQRAGLLRICPAVDRGACPRRIANLLTYWQPLAAAASVAGLAFVLLQMLPREQRGGPSLQRQESAPVATADAPALDAVPASPALPAPPAAKAEATASGSAEFAGESRADRSKVAAPEMAGRAGPAGAAAPAAIAMSSERNVDDTAALLDAAAWAARIGALHAAGDVTAAEQALRDFRATEPQADTHLPESLRTWARTVR